MRARGVDPLEVTGDDLRVYKAALLAAGQAPATVARVLSVLRGTYQQFGKKGLVDWDRVVSSLDSLIPLPQRQTVYALMREINKALSGYVRGQLMVCGILGTYYAIALTLAGLNFGLLIGVVSGFLTFIPYVGSLTALVVSFAVAVAPGRKSTSWPRVADTGGFCANVLEAEQEALARTLLSCLSRPFDLERSRVSITACAGIAHCGSPQTIAAELLRDARVAMFQARREGQD